jgi:hypothetical protein
MMPSLWSLRLQHKKHLAKTGKVLQTTTLPKFALYQDSVAEYTISFYIFK